MKEVMIGSLAMTALSLVLLLRVVFMIFDRRVITKDGAEIDCIVKLEDGMHNVCTLDGKHIFKQLRYWRG